MRLVSPNVPSNAAGTVGRPAEDDRRFVDGVLWVLRSGMRWQDMPERYGKYKTTHKRFTRWAGTGVWDRLSPICSRTGRPVCHDRLKCRSRSPSGRDGAKKMASETALGRSRGGLTTKIHLLADALGLPLSFVLTGGQTHDCTQAIALLGDRRPEAVLADKGYDTDSILSHLATRNIQAVIPPRSMRKVQRTFDRTLYRQRNRIERTFAQLKQFRRLATRFDKLKQNFQATVAIAYASRWLRQYIDTTGNICSDKCTKAF
nr:IS5 family transposase [Granulicella sp. L60]